MQGIEILNTIYICERLVKPEWIDIFSMIAFIISIFGICTIDYDIIQRILIGLEVLAIIGVIISFICALIPTNKIIDTQYKVTISDEVSMTEFYEHYEMIDHNGKIFTVREKTNER